MEPMTESSTDRGVHRILANSIYRAAAEVGSKLASLVLFAVMARKLGDESFGVFAFGLAFVMLVTALANFGQDWILTREVAREQRRIHHYFGNTLVLKTLLAVPALAIGVTGAWLLGSDAETVAVIVFLGIAVVVEQYLATVFGAFQAHDRVDFIALMLLSQRIFTAISGVAALLLGADVVFVSAVYLVGACLALALALAVLARRVVRPRAAVDRGAWWPLMRVALPVGVATVFGTILFRVDIAILALFASDAVVGHYAGAFRLFEATLFLSWSIGTATYPVFSRLTRRSAPPAGLVFERSLKLVVAATLPLALGAAVLAEPVITLFYGSEFEPGAVALSLLAPAIALYPIAHIAGALLVAQDRQLAVAVVFGFVATQNLVGNLILIPLFSLEGAAVETSITQLLLTIAFVALTTRTVGSLDWFRILAGPAIAGAAAAAMMLALSHVFPAAIATAAAAYALTLFVFERLTYPEDARTLSRFIRREAG
jgi:O-antigen/teichoic acid export membrane protein